MIETIIDILFEIFFNKNGFHNFIFIVKLIWSSFGYLSGPAALLAVFAALWQLIKINDQLDIASDENKLNMFIVLIEIERDINISKKEFEDALLNKKNQSDKNGEKDDKELVMKIKIAQENYFNKLDRLSSLILRNPTFEEYTGMKREYSTIIEMAVRMIIKAEKSGIFDNIEALHCKWKVNE